jgi:hypothetical protein
MILMAKAAYVPLANGMAQRYVDINFNNQNSGFAEDYAASRPDVEDDPYYFYYEYVNGTNTKVNVTQGSDTSNYTKVPIPGKPLNDWTIVFDSGGSFLFV